MSACNRCGFCCLAEVCPVGLHFLGGPRKRPCPALKFDGKTAACGLYELVPEDRKKEAAEDLGIGTGCDTKARVISSQFGVQVDFASLPDEMKIQIVDKVREGMIPVAHSRSDDQIEGKKVITHGA